MRISDWSSDVCSSYLRGIRRGRARTGVRGSQCGARGRGGRDHVGNARSHGRLPEDPPPVRRSDRQLPGVAASRSEEHTSELQSLMRISYAVFCLKKKKTKSIHNKHPDDMIRTIYHIKR